VNAEAVDRTEPEVATEASDERTSAVWRPGMSPGTYRRLLRLLFDSGHGDGGASAADLGERAA
jgi:hypothetical protein